MDNRTSESLPDKPILDLTDKGKNKPKDHSELLNEPKKVEDASKTALEAHAVLFDIYNSPEGQAILGEGSKPGEGVGREGKQQNTPDMTPKKGNPRDDNLAGVR